VSQTVLHVDLSDKRCGGGQFFLHFLLQGLAREGRKTLLIALKDTLFVQFVKVRRPEYAIFEFDPKSLRSWLELFRLIRSHKCIHFHRRHEALFMWLAKLLNPAIKSLLLHHDHLKRSKRFIVPINMHIYNSNYIKDLYSPNLYKPSVQVKEARVLYPLIETPKSDLSISSPKETEGAPCLLMAGSPWKNQVMLAEVMHTVHQKYPEAKLYLTVSDSSGEKYFPRIQARFEQANSLSTLKVLRDVDREEYLKMLQRADVYVHAHQNEPFGIVIWEACKLKKRIVAMSGGGSSEILKDYPLAKLVDDEKAFAEAVCEAYESGPGYDEELMRAWQSRAEFDYDSMIREYNKIYQELLES